jgi:hypothetical protein
VQDANWNTTAIIAATGVPGVPILGMIISRFIYSPYGDVQVLTRLWETPAAGSTPAAPWSHLFQGLKFTDVTGLASARTATTRRAWGGSSSGTRSGSAPGTTTGIGSWPMGRRGGRIRVDSPT